jgi:hypothetical protein
LHNGAGFFQNVGSGSYNVTSATPITAIRLVGTGGGNITSGTATLYGILN